MIELYLVCYMEFEGTAGVLVVMVGRMKILKRVEPYLPAYHQSNSKDEYHQIKINVLLR